MKDNLFSDLVHCAHLNWLSSTQDTPHKLFQTSGYCYYFYMKSFHGTPQFIQLSWLRRYKHCSVSRHCATLQYCSSPCSLLQCDDKWRNYHKGKKCCFETDRHVLTERCGFVLKCNQFNITGNCARTGWSAAQW
jgi:hypothetical protein